MTDSRANDAVAGGRLRPLVVRLLAAILFAWSAEALAGAAGEDPEPEQAWVAEAEETAAGFREAVIRGADRGERRTVYVDFGGATRRGTVVAASEKRLTVSVGGAQVPLPWSKLSPSRLYYIGRSYLPAKDAGAHLRRARYCAVHGLLKEAGVELEDALRREAGLLDEVRAVNDFLHAKERARAAGRAAAARGAAGRAAAARGGASGSAKEGKLDRAAYFRAAMSTDAASLHRRLGPDWEHYHKESEVEFPEAFLRHADGHYIYKFKGDLANSGAADWTGMAGQVLYAPAQKNNAGADRIRFSWSFHQGHGGSKYWHVYQLAPTMKEWYCKSPDPGLTNREWSRAAGGRLSQPVAVARGKVSWSNCGIMIFRNGLVGATGYGNNDDRYPCTKLPPGKVPTAVAVTPNNEFALVTVWDVRKMQGELAVVALEARALAHHSWYYAGLPNVGTYTRLKVMGFVELPDVAAPTAVAAAGDVSRWRWTTNVSKERLDTQAARDQWMKGGGDHVTSSAGYALVVSREEDKAVFVDLGPLFRYMRKMYFTTQEEFDKTKNEGQAPNQWPFTFEVAPEARPKAVKTIPIPRPTAVAAGFAGGHGVRDGGFVTKAFATTEDGRLVIFDVSALISPGRASGGVRPVGTVKVGRNPTCIAHGRHGQPHDDLVVVCRGDREVDWVRLSGNEGAVTKRLKDARLADPVWAELWDTRGAAGVSIADFRGKKIVNYQYRPIDSWGEKLFGGLGKEGDAEFECTGVLEVPGLPFLLSSAEVN